MVNISIQLQEATVSCAQEAFTNLAWDYVLSSSSAGATYSNGAEDKVSRNEIQDKLWTDFSEIVQLKQAQLITVFISQLIDHVNIIR